MKHIPPKRRKKYHTLLRKYKTIILILPYRLTLEHIRHVIRIIRLHITVIAPGLVDCEEERGLCYTYVGHLESKERLRIQPAQLFNFS